MHAAADLTQATLAELDLATWRRAQAVNDRGRGVVDSQIVCVDGGAVMP